MFYVLNKHIYMATLDTERNLYPEVQLTVDESGRLFLKRLDTGLEARPSGAARYTSTEVIAQMGYLVTASDEATSTEDTAKDDSKSPVSTQPKRDLFNI